MCHHHRFEVFLERPSTVLACAQTRSRYKHQNTYKFLIGIAPQGSITYVSRAWGGHVSDVHEHCGIVINFQHGDYN